MFKLILLSAIVGVALGAPSGSNSLFYPVSTNRTLGIVGGTPADISQFPWQVSVQFSGQHYCGGSLIAPTWVLTAAHCVAAYNTNLNIRAGSSKTSSGGVSVKVDGFVIHPNYRESTSDSDVALLRLSAPVNNVNAKAVQLPQANQEVQAGASLTVTGWGSISEGSPSSANLLQTTVPVVSRQQCANAYTGINQVTNTMLCAGLLGQGGKDACQGDSGGPAIVNNQLVGVVSWGLGCARPNYPGVYAQVSVFRTWIKQYTGV